VSDEMSVLRDLIAERDIRRVLVRYCRSMDRIDASLGYTVWHEDGLADYGRFFKGTGRGFIDWVCDLHRTMDAQSHQITNTLISICGPTAVSESYVAVSLLYRSDGAQLLMSGSGRYLDNWSFRNDRWAIDERVYVHDIAHTRRVEPMDVWGLRDGSDRSYATLGALGRA
jgi:hypothetical protein